MSEKQWLTVAFAFLLVVFSGTCWSLFQYLEHPGTIESEYLKAKVISTPLENDHVRFSWMMAVAIICTFLMMEMIKKRIIRILLAGLSLFLAVYLHILAARTGLL